MAQSGSRQNARPRATRFVASAREEETAFLSDSEVVA